MEMEEVEAVLEKIWDLHDKFSDAIHSISRTHFLNSLKSHTKKSQDDVPDDNRTGFVFVKDFRLGDDDSAIKESKSLNAIRTALENLEDQLEFFHVSCFSMFFIFPCFCLGFNLLLVLFGDWENWGNWRKGGLILSNFSFCQVVF